MSDTCRWSNRLAEILDQLVQSLRERHPRLFRELQYHTVRDTCHHSDGVAGFPRGRVILFEFEKHCRLRKAPDIVERHRERRAIKTFVFALEGDIAVRTLRQVAPRLMKAERIVVFAVPDLCGPDSDIELPRSAVTAIRNELMRLASRRSS